jgi:RNA polymerase sigma-70 factor (ECF subfamily)
MTRLNAAQREVLLLHDLEGWTHNEIAARLDISVLMSRRHLSDARKRLRAVLGLGSGHD